MGPCVAYLLVARLMYFTFVDLQSNITGLIPELDAPIYGSIAALNSYRPIGSDTDVLFLLTHRNKVIAQSCAFV